MKKNNGKRRDFQIRNYTVKELSEHYEVTPPTMRKWIARFATKIGEKSGNFYLATQVEIIVKKIGFPPNYTGNEMV